VRIVKPTVNITDQLEALVADLCARMPALAHIDARRVLVCLTRTRRRAAGGTFAKIVPMCFADGTPFKRDGDVLYALPQIPTPAGDVRYLIYLYVPRFFEQPAERRLLTLIHELYHIAPAFDGTIRRFGSRAHGNSRDDYNARLEPLVQAYLAAAPPADITAPLHADLRALAKTHTIIGRSLAIPKAVRMVRGDG
jgi:hypothetical protein